MDKLKYLKYYYINSAYRVLYQKVKHKKYNTDKFAGKRVLTPQEGNDIIREAIKKGDSFMAGRFGSSELRGVADTAKADIGLTDRVRDNTAFCLCNNAGFFPNSDEYVKRFGHLMMECCGQCDLLGVWFNVMEDYIIKKYTNQSVLTKLSGIEPYYHENPWSAELKGKKVLVIHPFEKSIQSQYEKRKKIFPGTDILPEFELKTIKAVQTIAGEKSEFKDWFEALDYMLNKAKAIDFDVAIVGCGAYGFPLAAKIKQMGKAVIHMAGATQLLFGIKGARWDNNSIVSKMYNESWTRPLDEETPQKAKGIEGGCYW